MQGSNEFRQIIPFLRDIPDAIFYELHPGEWYLPSGDVESARQRLEAELDAYVMTYTRGVFLKELPACRHLCMCLEGASLDGWQKAILHAFERRFTDRGVSFVAYRKPLRILDVASSAILSASLTPLP